MLPVVETDEEWDAIVPEDGDGPGGGGPQYPLRARRGPLTRFPEGSQPVYAVGDEHVLKLFPGPPHRTGPPKGGF
ncbi:hypothetical protein [Streptomyces sp. H27-C3]|uniref:hypothetical protein n=1 Tax=Streptomyces sp. H27-C3 TaxID=3046305 RepID=UPI0024B9EA8D|nr:hypothetical protein [Streptomyces sp. H27-C3]MDJ0460215.1 hypothetical protein [Streptomyces sp. H27-C3]